MKGQNIYVHECGIAECLDCGLLLDPAYTECPACSFEEAPTHVMCWHCGGLNEYHAPGCVEAIRNLLNRDAAENASREYSKRFEFDEADKHELKAMGVIV